MATCAPRCTGGNAAGGARQAVDRLLPRARLDAVVPLYQLPPPLTAQARGPASDPLNLLLRDVGYNYLKGRIRSHPDVAQRFYRDVIGV